MTASGIMEPMALRTGGGNGFERRDGLREGGSLPEPVKDEARPTLVCRVCRAAITRPDLAMEVNGSHRHVFFNPHGLVFELGCFASVRNVLLRGPKTEDFTWFPGHAWQVATCTGCASQLGWRYTSARGGFFGLILAALIEDDRA